MMPKHYLPSGFDQCSRAVLGKFMGEFPHTPIKVSESSLGEDISPRVFNAADRVLCGEDTVYVDKFGRVNGFTIGDSCYIISES